MPTAHKKKKTSKKVRRKMRAGSALRLDIDDLPDDPSALKETLREMQDSVRLLDADCDLLEHRLNLELARRYGRRSERRDADHPDQGYLFGEPPAEVPAESVDDDASGDPQEEASEPLESSTPKKRKGRNGRRRLPGHLPREETVLELEEDDRRCHCCAEPMGEIGREVSETLDYKPASLFVRRTIRPKYACQKCHEGVLTAEPPRGPIERGLPGPGLLAQVVVGKYADHLPLNRQESILARHGLEISRQTLSDWVAAVANLYTPIRDVLKAQILKGPRIFTDDTQVRVLNPERRVKKPPGEKRKQKKGAQKGTLWVYVGDESTVFDYTKSRSRDGPLRFLEGYRGYLQADGFPGYRAVYRRGGVTEVACMAITRRKFHDARSNDRRRCRYALDRFGELYQIERDLKTGVPPPKRVAHSVRLWRFRFSRRSKPGSTLNARGCCPRAPSVRPSAMR